MIPHKKKQPTPLKKMNKTQYAEKTDLSGFMGSLNFAFCPSVALTLSSDLMKSTDEFKELSENLDETCVNYLSRAMKYFYICYSFKMDNFSSNGAENYFYFQLFSQIGPQQAAASPIYGFYAADSMIDIIKEIDGMFEEKDYDKQIFDSFQNEAYGSATELINLMQKWSALKLEKFKDLYYQNESAVQNLSNLILYGSELLNSQKANNVKKKRKPVTAKKTTKKAKKDTKKNNKQD